MEENKTKILKNIGEYSGVISIFFLFKPFLSQCIERGFFFNSGFPTCFIDSKFNNPKVLIFMFVILLFFKYIYQNKEITYSKFAISITLFILVIFSLSLEKFEIILILNLLVLIAILFFTIFGLASFIGLFISKAKDNNLPSNKIMNLCNNYFSVIILFFMLTVVSLFFAGMAQSESRIGYKCTVNNQDYLVVRMYPDYCVITDFETRQNLKRIDLNNHNLELKKIVLDKPLAKDPIPIFFTKEQIDFFSKGYCSKIYYLFKNLFLNRLFLL